MSEAAPSSRTRLAAALAALLAMPALVLLDTAVALARGWEPRGPLVRWVATACLAAIVLPLLAAATRVGRELLVRRWAAIFTMAVSLALGWAVVETLAWAAPGLLGNRFAHSRGPGVHRVFRPDPRIIAGISGESHYTTDELGIRGGPFPAAPGIPRILCLGGSTTECTYLDDDATWPHLLQEELRVRSGRPAWPVWVGGLGISGYTTFEHLDFLRRSPLARRFDRRFDRIILLVGIDDLVRFLSGALELGPRPLWRRSTLVSTLAAAVQRRVLRHLLYEEEDATGRSLLERRRLRREAPQRADLPDLRKALADYQDRIAGLADACRRVHARCLFLTQPVLWQEALPAAEQGSLWMGTDGRGAYYTAGALRQGMDRYNSALLAVCARRGLECLDLAASLSGRPGVFYDDCHFTAAGAREVAHQVADDVADGLAGDLAGVR